MDTWPHNTRWTYIVCLCPCFGVQSNQFFTEQMYTAWRNKLFAFISMILIFWEKKKKLYLSHTHFFILFQDTIFVWARREHFLLRKESSAAGHLWSFDGEFWSVIASPFTVKIKPIKNTSQQNWGWKYIIIQIKHIFKEYLFENEMYVCLL